MTHAAPIAARGRLVRLDSRSSWERARRIGSSDVAKILGRSRYGTAWDVWLRLTRRDRRSSTTSAQARGTTWEPIVLHLYAEETGRPVRRPPPFALWDGPDQWATASPDALTRDVGEAGVVEAKTDVHVDEWGEPDVIERWSDAAARIVRPDYALQCYHLARVLGVEFVDLAVLLPYYGLRVYRIVRDRDVEAELVEVLGDWYDRHVVHDEEPEIDGSGACRGYLVDRFAGGSREMRPGTDAEALLAQRVAVADAMIKRLEDQREVDRNALLAAIGDLGGVEWGVGPDRPRVTVVRSAGRKTVDLAAARAAHPELEPVLQQFTHRGRPSAWPRLTRVPHVLTPGVTP